MTESPNEAARKQQEVELIAMYEAILGKSREYAQTLAAAGFSLNQINLQISQMEEHYRLLKKRH